MLEPRPVTSPCVSICVLNPATGLCDGCFRTLKEIAAWGGLTASERERVMAALPERQAKAGAAR